MFFTRTIMQHLKHYVEVGTEQNPEFRTPEVLHSSTHDNRTILFLTRVPGRTLTVAWPTLSTEEQEYYPKAIVDSCKIMAEWKGDAICGVGGKNIPEYYLSPRRPRGSADPEDFSPESLKASCLAMDMDCSSFCFYHADLNPENIIVDDKRIGIIDWEIAGYVPRGWIGTKFLVSAAMHLTEDTADLAYHQYKLGIAKLLPAAGFKNHGYEFREWDDPRWAGGLILSDKDVRKMESTGHWFRSDPWM